MTTATEIITEALENIGYIGAETVLEAADEIKAFKILNDMLAEWGESGTLPGAMPVGGLSDDIRASRGVISAIKMNLSGRCAAPFQVPITPTLAAAISASSEGLLRITAKIGDVAYPDTLPVGSGNECREYIRFYPVNVEQNF